MFCGGSKFVSGVNKIKVKNEKRSNYVPYKLFQIIQELKQTFLKVADHINFIFTFVNNDTLPSGVPNIETPKTLY